MSRRNFIRITLVAAAMAAVPGVIAVTSAGRDEMISFDLSFDESVQVLFAYGTRLGTYDITVREEGVDVEHFKGVSALEVQHLESDYVTVAPASAPVAA